jgi:hypothetical protein
VPTLFADDQVITRLLPGPHLLRSQTENQRPSLAGVRGRTHRPLEDVASCHLHGPVLWPSRFSTVSPAVTRSDSRRCWSARPPLNQSDIARPAAFSNDYIVLASRLNSGHSRFQIAAEDLYRAIGRPWARKTQLKS